MGQTIDFYLKDLYIREDQEYIQEIDIKKAFERISTKGQLNQIINKLRKVRGAKPEEISKTLKALRIPVIRYRKLDTYFSDKIDNYDTNRDKAFLILKNSLPGANKKLLLVAASFLSIKSLVKRKNSPIAQQDKILKNSLKDFVSEVRETEEEHKEDNEVLQENLLDYAVGSVLLSTGILVVLAIAKGFMLVLSVAEPVIITAGILLLLALIAISISWATGVASIAQ